jgi:release factor glutamine methyltransferase
MPRFLRRGFVCPVDDNPASPTSRIPGGTPTLSHASSRCSAVAREACRQIASAQACGYNFIDESTSAIVRLRVDDLRARDDLGTPYGLGRGKLPLSRSKQLLRKAIHFLSYHFILKRRRTTAARVAGFRLTVRPTVFHPRYFLTSGFFASFLAGLDLNGKRVADVGTGSGILALAAARAGAANVIAIDINPNAAETAVENARANGLDSRVTAVASNLLSALTSLPIFDVILSSPPSFPGEPRDLADRAWHAGPNYRDIASLFNEARDRLAPGGCLYVLLSTDSDLELLGNLISEAGFRSRIVARRSIVIEHLLIFELRSTRASNTGLAT